MTDKITYNAEKLSFFERIQLYLFDDDTNIPEWHAFTEKELEIKNRYSAIFSFWLDKPTVSDRKLTTYITTELGVGKSQAWRDIQQVKILLGNVRNATKQWQRFKVIAMLDKAYEIAEAKKDAKSIILAASTLGKFTQLDKEDLQVIPYDEIVPQNWEITDDVSVLGLVPIEDLEQKQRKMREKYGATLIEEADIIDESKQ